MEWMWAAIAAAATLGLASALRDALRVPALVRQNYAGREVPSAGGIAAVGGFVLTLAAMALFDESRAALTYRAVIVVLGFSVVGLFDDIVGTHAARGIRGHIAAARRGRLTSGAAKLVLGVAVAVMATAPFVAGGKQRLLQVVLIAGAANVGNLFDLAPARATKAAALALVPLFVVYRPTSLLIGPLCFAAAIAALAVFELREDVMLGDTGANALGAVVGLAFAITGDVHDTWLWPAALVVVALNIAGEFVSFSRVIDAVAPLRFVDRLGRRR